ncbi:MAG TPA: M23 family metallopeptidase [Actinomycetota bacterium]|nr:M23 family metallopeptidase [Actinomycetota bacterium]
MSVGTADGAGTVESPPRRRTKTRLTRRGRLVAWVLAAVGIQAIAVGAFQLSVAPAGPVGLLGAALPVQPIPLPQTALGARPAVPTAQPMASVRGLTLFLPATQVTVVAYHEAALARALRLRPDGRCIRNANKWKFTTPKPTAGPDYMVMSSRGRPHPATSAVDVAMPKGSRVLAPVTGTIVSVKRYYLYGQYFDFKVVVRPTSSPKLLVTIIHLDRLRVHKGDVVTAGRSAIGIPRVFPFGSQVNNYIGAGIPHVHLEVKERGA